jgi:hypothetical protein
MSTDVAAFKQIAEFLNGISQKYNFGVAKTSPIGKPASDKSNAREFRMQLINTSNDTSDTYKKELPKAIAADKSFKNVKFNELSPNSSKYSSVSFNFDGRNYDVVISKGANKGENFEKNVVTDLQRFFSKSGVNSSYEGLINQLTSANPDFAVNEIKSVKQRTGSTRKEGAPIERLGEIIGDIVLTDSTNKQWFISLKDVNGDTFSSYSGAATLIQSDGTLNPKSEGADFLNAFGVDLNLVQKGYDSRNNKTIARPNIKVSKQNPTAIKNIFERAWGMNYFYVRKTSGGWKTFWLDRDQLNKLTNNIKVNTIKYPDKSSKQITILCENSYASYNIEIRNSKGGEYPNDIKFRVKKINL